MTSSSKLLIGLAFGVLMITKSESPSVKIDGNVTINGVDINDPKCDRSRIGNCTGGGSVRINGENVTRRVDIPEENTGGMKRAPLREAPFGKPIYEGDAGLDFEGVTFDKDIVLGTGVKLGTGSELYDDVQIGDNSKLFGEVIVDYGVRIGKRSTLGDGTEVDWKATIGDGVTIGKGVKIGPYVILHNGVTLHDGSKVKGNTHVGSGTQIYGEVEEELKIGFGTIIKSEKVGKDTKIGNRVKLLSKNAIRDFVTFGDNVTVEEGAILGRNTTFKDNVIIGRGARVDNNVTVTQNVAEGEHVTAKTQSPKRSQSLKRSPVNDFETTIECYFSARLPPTKGLLIIKHPRDIPIDELLAFRDKFNKSSRAALQTGGSSTVNFNEKLFDRNTGVKL